MADFSGIGIVGTANFSASGGSISSLVVKGVISSVTYTSVGHYTVNFNTTLLNYAVYFTYGDNTMGCLMQTFVPLGSTSFNMVVVEYNESAFFNPTFVGVMVVP